VHYGDDWIRGSEQVLLDLFAHVDRSQFEPILWCNNEALAVAARKVGILTYRSEMRYFFLPESPSFDFAFYRALQKTGQDLIVRHRVALVHVNGGAPCQWMLPVARRRRLPLLVHLHAPYLRKHRYFLLFHQALCAVGVGENVIAELRKDGMAQERLAIVANGIDPARVTAKGTDLRATLNIPEETVVIGSVGSLISRKGHDLAIQAFSALGTQGDARLLIVGSGPEQASLQALVHKLGMSGRISFLGNFDDMSSVYRAMDINILATRSEAFGLVLVEAALAGVPSISTRVGGVPDIIQDQANGILVQSEDVPALTEALRCLIVDTPLRRRYGAAARLDAEMRFSASTMCAQFGTLYRRMIATPPNQHGWSAAFHARPYLRLIAGAGKTRKY